MLCEHVFEEIQLPYDCNEDNCTYARAFRCLKCTLIIKGM